MLPGHFAFFLLYKCINIHQAASISSITWHKKKLELLSLKKYELLHGSHNLK
jgi:hypothetical protein